MTYDVIREDYIDGPNGPPVAVRRLEGLSWKDALDQQRSDTHRARCTGYIIADVRRCDKGYEARLLHWDDVLDVSRLRVITITRSVPPTK